MKFLFFNLMAVIAILYLVAVDGKPMNYLPDFLSFVSSKDAQNLPPNIPGDKSAYLAERARKKLENFKAMVEPSATVAKNPVQKKIAKVEPEVKATPQPESVEISPRPVHIVPNPKLANKSVIKPAVKPAPIRPRQKFMSRAERRRDLNRLAHDMEMMFADKLSD